MRLLDSLSQYWSNIQRGLFPWLMEELGELTEKQRLLVSILEMVRVEEFVPRFYGLRGRKQKERAAIARSFVAKAVYKLPTTRCLLDRLLSDKRLVRICGWERGKDIPSESTFSRAFADFAQTQLPQRVHDALIEKSLSNELVGHISRDSTGIEGREKAKKKSEKRDSELREKGKRKRGRPKKGDEKVKEPTRMERQQEMFQ